MYSDQTKSQGKINIVKRSYIEVAIPHTARRETVDSARRLDVNDVLGRVSTQKNLDNYR